MAREVCDAELIGTQRPFQPLFTAYPHHPYPALIHRTQVLLLLLLLFFEIWSGNLPLGSYIYRVTHFPCVLYSNLVL